MNRIGWLVVALLAAAVGAAALLIESSEPQSVSSGHVDAEPRESTPKLERAPLPSITINRTRVPPVAVTSDPIPDSRVPSGPATVAPQQTPEGVEPADLAAKRVRERAKASSLIADFDAATAERRDADAEDAIAALEKLIPEDPRMPQLRDRLAALPGPRRKLVVDLGSGIAMEFVLIRAGAFTMGQPVPVGLSGYGIGTTPLHKVTISEPFYLGKFEVTQEQWLAVTNTNPSLHKGVKNPVDNVSWDDCQEFLRLLCANRPGPAFTLPTDAQWEYACRAGTTTAWSCGDDEASLRDVAWCDHAETHPVGTKKPNPWGLHDMHGNVEEWCSDWYAALTDDAQTDPTGPIAQSSRVPVRTIRGGDYDSAADSMRSGMRHCEPQDRRWAHFGFRVARPIRQ